MGRLGGWCSNVHEQGPWSATLWRKGAHPQRSTLLGPPVNGKKALSDARRQEPGHGPRGLERRVGNAEVSAGAGVVSYWSAATRTSTRPVTFSQVARISASPGVTARMAPPATVATEGFDELHWASVVTS